MAQGQGGIGGRGRGMRGGGGGMSGGINIFGLVRDIASVFSGNAGRQARPDDHAVSVELRSQVELLKEERGLLKDRVDLLERKLELLESKRKAGNCPDGGKHGDYDE